jgi:hypothetical protein
MVEKMTLIIPYNDYEDFKKAIITYMEQLDEENQHHQNLNHSQK